VLLSVSCNFRAVQCLFSFLQIVIIIRGLTKGKVVTPLINYKIILF